MTVHRLAVSILAAALGLSAGPALACSPDLADAAVGPAYAEMQNGTFLSPPIGDLVFDLHGMKLYSRNGSEQWPDFFFYIGAAVQTGLLSVEARYDDGTPVSTDDLVAGQIDKKHAFLGLRVTPTDRGAALSRRTGLPDADSAFYIYNGKMVVDGVDGNELKHFGTDSYRVITVHDHVVDVPEEVDAILKDTWDMAKSYDYKLDFESWTGAHVATPRHETALLRLDPESCTWKLAAVDAARAGEKFTTHSVDNALAQLQNTGQEL
jgi:hypothetical protein